MVAYRLTSHDERSRDRWIILPSKHGLKRSDVHGKIAIPPRQQNSLQRTLPIMKIHLMNLCMVVQPSFVTGPKRRNSRNKFRSIQKSWGLRRIQVSPTGGYPLCVYLRRIGL